MLQAGVFSAEAAGTINRQGELGQLQRHAILPMSIAGQHLRVIDINDVGQALVVVNGAADSPQKLISPSGL